MILAAAAILFGDIVVVFRRRRVQACRRRQLRGDTISRVPDDRTAPTGLTEEPAWRGRRVRWLRHGSGPPVVFCHGTPWSSWLWAPFAEALAAQFTSYLLDMPGYGASSKDPGHAVSLDAQGELLNELLGRWGLDARTWSRTTTAARWRYALTFCTAPGSRRWLWLTWWRWLRVAPSSSDWSATTTTCLQGCPQPFTPERCAPTSPARATLA